MWIMKNTTILLLLFCCAFPAFIQGQTEFSQTGTIWKTNYFSYGFMNNKYVDIDYVYELGGDTLIGDKSCKKLYLDDGLIGAFLEENQKVWYYPFNRQSDVQDRLLMYDFSKNKGDKIESYQIVYNYGDLSSSGFSGETETLTVQDVHYENGRKVMEISSDYGNSDVWIEGIGSPRSFYGAYLMIPTDGSNTSISLVQVLSSDNKVLFYKGQAVDPDYQSTFLKPGKTWEVLTPSNSIDKITIGEPQMIDNYPRYPVYKGNYHYDGGYLYDVNGTIFWLFGGYYNDFLNCDFYLYSFDLSEGNRVSLCVAHNTNMVYYVPPKYEYYAVSQTDHIQCMGKTLKRIVLEGEIKHVWLEDVGSLNLLLYLDGNGYHYNAPDYKLLRCYVGDEMIYDSSDFPDGIEKTLLSTPTYSAIDNQLIVKNGHGYSLSLYDLSGVEVFNQILSESEQTVPLPVHSATMLIGRLQKGEITISFKIGDTGK